MKFNSRNSSIFSFYWSIGYYISVIIHKLYYSILVLLSIILLRSSKIEGEFSTNMENILNVVLYPYIFVEKLLIKNSNLIKNNITSLVRLKKAYEDLKKVNTELKVKLLAINAISNENNSLKKILGFTSHESVENYTIKQVNIINKNSFVTTMDIDINDDDRDYFDEHDIVVDKEGNFVGILIDIQDKMATVMLASDLAAKIPSKVIGSNISLILEGKGNDILGIKHFLGKKENIRVGDKVYTSSNDDSTFYNGIYIGNIVAINNRLYVKLAANFNNLDYVLILHRTPKIFPETNEDNF